MNKAKQILEEALSYKNCGGLIEENSRLEDIILYAINQALHQPDVIKPVCPDCDSEREPNPPFQQASISSSCRVEACSFARWIAEETHFKPTGKVNEWSALHMGDGWVIVTVEQLYDMFKEGAIN